MVKLASIVLVVSLAYILLCVFNFSPEEVREKGEAFAGRVIRTIERREQSGDESERVVVELENGNEETISVISVGPITVGEELPLWKYKGVWYVDKYDNMETPSPLPAIVIFVLSLVTIVYWKVFRRQSKFGQK